MPDEEKLEEAIAALRARFGANALYRLGSQQKIMPALLPTGFATLDDVLDGGLPRGRPIQLGGIPTAGVVTLALKVIASAQQQSLPILYIDLEQSFDPVYASRCGVLPADLTLVHAGDGQQALAVMTDLILGGWDGLLVLDLGTIASELILALPLALDRALAPLARSGGTLFLLHAGRLAVHHAPVRLWLEREVWLYHNQDIHGYRALVEVTQKGAARRRLHLDFTFAGVDSL